MIPKDFITEWGLGGTASSLAVGVRIGCCAYPSPGAGEGQEDTLVHAPEYFPSPTLGEGSEG